MSLELSTLEQTRADYLESIANRKERIATLSNDEKVEHTIVLRKKQAALREIEARIEAIKKAKPEQGAVSPEATK